jgi:hypothetical protein
MQSQLYGQPLLPCLHEGNLSAVLFNPAPNPRESSHQVYDHSWKGTLSPSLLFGDKSFWLASVNSQVV